MNLSIFRDPKLARDLLSHIQKLVDKEPGRTYTFMEVCGTHTVSIARYGFRSILPDTIRLLSGPGCPVCVTHDEDINKALALSQIENVIITTFGDMMRVPGTHASLHDQKAEGMDIRVCYSPLDSLQIARENPDKEVIFIGVGFETTVPIIGAAIMQAAEEGITNFSVYGAHKTMPNALEAIVSDPDICLDGLILPGHVSTIIGKKPYEFLAKDYHIPGVITGFEPIDILRALIALITMAQNKTARIVNSYPRGVRDEGNIAAQKLIAEMFEVEDVLWRGLGVIKQSGLTIAKKYESYNAEKRFDIPKIPSLKKTGCKCGDILRGIMAPDMCPLFGSSCNPEHPIGPCMVSSEGSCAAYFRFNETSSDHHKQVFQKQRKNAERRALTTHEQVVS